MLDKVAYIGDQKNGTFAQAITRTSQAVGVSLWLTDPPAVSHLCFHLSGLKVTDLMDEPLVVCLGKNIAIIRVIYNLGVRPIESVDDLSRSDCDYLVYRAHTDRPKLNVLPNPKPHMFHPSELGFFTCGDSEDFFMAVLRPRFVHLEYDLHIFSSRTNTWTISLWYKDDYLVHENDTVVTLEGGLLGWVDLWRGILLCNVLDSKPVVRYIQFPMPMFGNMCQYLQTPARAVRDVTFRDGFIKLIEMEDQKRLFATARASSGLWNGAAMLDSGLEGEASQSYFPGLHTSPLPYRNIRACLHVTAEVLVEGLDASSTVDQLKDVFTLFGELCYLKIHEERYALVKFASRQCAENAIGVLNGTEIGRKHRLSPSHECYLLEPEHKMLLPSGGEQDGCHRPQLLLAEVHCKSKLHVSRSYSHPFYSCFLMQLLLCTQLAGVPRSSSFYTQLSFCSRHPFHKAAAAAAAFQKLPPELLLLSSPTRSKHARTSCRATDNDQAAAQETTAPSPASSPAAAPIPNANGSEPPKRTPLTARERLRAARVLGKYAEPSAKKGSSTKSGKPEFGSGVLDALREADAKKAGGGGGGGGRRGSRLPEAPGNLFDDSKRGMPKEGWTFELPFGVDVFLVLVSFTLITTIMFGTAFLVWKLGGIHFNEY
ncbi:hypothetical protein HU200_044744 [Digitaria exilis]|uniref:RRM domain-containing protein n=1 Tax=Digitaria exilis TaxID=1010633 RepID=A0A835ECU0_9POAL|nr:hypothetical protein HU200_044744 [Digitaria exilis]